MSEPAARRSATIRDYGLALLLLAFLWSGLLYVLRAPWAHLTWLSLLIAGLRYALLGLAALCARPWPLSVLLVLSVALWATLDLLAIAGMFDVYGLLAPAGDALYFQF